MFLKNKISIKKLVLIFIGCSFFIGIWHAFPMLNVIGDEMYFVGGVLRAMEHHTIIPLANDVPYGTLTYILSYIHISFILSVLLPFFGFSLTSLKLFLVVHPSIMYFFLRVMSAYFALTMLYFVNIFLKRQVEDSRMRLILIILLFTNVITGIILHTGKMWVLSMLLVIISFFYLNKAIEDSENSPERNILLSIIFSFLALSNFPLNFFSLLNIPILLFNFRSRKDIIIKILKYSLFGLILYVLITSLNFQGIKNQVISIFTQYHPIEQGNIVKGLNFFQSIRVYSLKLIILFPLMLISLILSIRNGIKNKKVVVTSTIYLFSYFIIISLVANWSTDYRVDLRYLFPIGFFLTFLLSGLNLKFNKLFYLLCGVSIFYYVFLLYFLSVPTTYNQAYNWVKINLGDKKVLIINKIAELQLTKNNSSSAYTRDESCASKCKNIINFDLNSDFKPVVVDLLSKDVDLTKQNPDIYYIYQNPSLDKDLELIKYFKNEPKIYHTTEYNTGNYFDLSFFKVKNLGKDIYIYKSTRTENK